MSTVLVVDDIAAFREPIAAAIKAAGFDVQCAGDGAEALELLLSAFFTFDAQHVFNTDPKCLGEIRKRVDYCVHCGARGERLTAILAGYFSNGRLQSHRRSESSD